MQVLVAFIKVFFHALEKNSIRNLQYYSCSQLADKVDSALPLVQRCQKLSNQIFCPLIPEREY